MPPDTFETTTQEGGLVRATVTMLPGTEGIVDPSRRLAQPDEEALRLERAGAICPPYAPQYLCALYETSTALRPAVEALEANVDGHGHRFEPRIDLTAKGTRQMVAESMVLEALRGLTGLRSGALDFDALMPTDFAVDQRMKQIELRMRLEKAQLEALFSACCPGITYVALRKKWRRDREVTGNAYRGIRRDNGGNLAEFEYLPAAAMRIRPVIREPGSNRPAWVKVRVPVRRTPITVEYVTTHRAFRTFVQFGLVANVYFAEFGDPRVISAADGKVYPSVEELPHGHARATEVQHLKIDSALYEYGVPRWIGATPSVTGLRASQEVNATHFDNNAIPRMAILISGGTLKQGADKTLAAIFDAQCKGRENYGKLIIIEASPPTGAPTARVTIELKSLKESVPDDGLFLNYGARCRDEVLSQFRLPKFITGQLDDVNKSTAGEGLAFVEDQVFQPMRADDDALMDAILLNEGILFWRFVSNSPVSRDPETMTKNAVAMATAGALTVNDMRAVAADIFNRPFADLPESWGGLPFELAKLAFMPAPNAPTQASTAPLAQPSAEGEAPAVGKVLKRAPAPAAKATTPGELIAWLEEARDALGRGERAGYACEVDAGQERMLVLPMSSAELAELVEPAAG